MTWFNGVAHGDGGRVYRVKHQVPEIEGVPVPAEGVEYNWSVEFGKPSFRGGATSEENAKELAEAWETWQQAQDKARLKAERKG